MKISISAGVVTIISVVFAASMKLVMGEEGGLRTTLGEEEEGAAAMEMGRELAQEMERELRQNCGFGKCNCNKKVRIRKFCVRGKPDGGGDTCEIQFKMDGTLYYPIEGVNNCRMYALGAFGKKWDHTPGFCHLDQGTCHDLTMSNAQWITYKEGQELTLSYKEHSWGLLYPKYDTNHVTADKDKWWIDTCEPYEYKVSIEIGGAHRKSTCKKLDASGSASANAGGSYMGQGASIKGSVSASYTSSDCSDWVVPAKGYIWYLDVIPADM